MIIRPACMTDAQSMARVYVMAWQCTYRHILPDRYLDAMSMANYTKTFRKSIENNQMINQVAEDQRQGVVGFCTAGRRLGVHSIYSSEIYTIYISRHHQRQGIGQKLLWQLVSQLSYRKLFSVMVRVLKQNPYRRFYEKMGGVLCDRQKIAFAGTQLDSVSYGWISTDLLLEKKTP